MVKKWMWRLGAAAGACALLALGVHLYGTNQGLRLRAALGQKEAQLALALREYRAGESSSAFELFEPLIIDNYPPAVAVLCEVLDQRHGFPSQEPGCSADGAASIEKRLEQIGDLAFYAGDWAVVERVLERRIAAGDGQAHFDLARFEAMSQPEAVQVEAVEAHLQASAQAGDPRGQYLLAVYQLRDAAEGEARAPFVQSFATLLSQVPPVSAADAYFELAKMMQAGLISSDLAYIEVLSRADLLGNPYAAGHVAQYLLANPQVEHVNGLDADAWVARAATNGDPVAQYNRALHLLEGVPSEVKTDEAERLLQASAATGFAPSSTRLGALYWQQPLRAGENTEAGRQEAIAFWRSAADKGDANALYNLGQVALAQGNREAALKLLENAAQRGSDAAKLALDAAR